MVDATMDVNVQTDVTFCGREAEEILRTVFVLHWGELEAVLLNHARVHLDREGLIVHQGVLDSYLVAVKPTVQLPVTFKVGNITVHLKEI
jgi:hypothetical protein